MTTSMPSNHHELYLLDPLANSDDEHDQYCDQVQFETAMSEDSNDVITGSSLLVSYTSKPLITNTVVGRSYMLCLAGFCLLLAITSIPSVVVISKRLDFCSVQHDAATASRLCHHSSRMNTSEPQSEQANATCTCFNETSACCHRTVLRTHKFGYMVTQELYKPFDPLITRQRIGLAVLTSSNIDYRHVVIIRDIFDAIVSGFLYHQTGHECWISFNGYSVSPSRQKNFNWEHYITYHTVSYPPRNGRSICQYLVDESLQDAMRVYIDVALSKWYDGVAPYFEELARRRAVDQTVERTWVVCFEDYTNASIKEALFQESMDFLYPGGHRFQIPVEPEAYDGAHSTSHDPETRQILLDLVHEMDESIFDHALERLNRFHQCDHHR